MRLRRPGGSSTVPRFQGDKRFKGTTVREYHREGAAIRVVVGGGYLGLPVAHGWLASGDQTYVVTRSAERARQLAQSGLRPIVGDVTKPDRLPQIPPADTVLWSVGHDRQSGMSIRDVYVDGLHNVLEQLHPQTRRLIYISSTGVYGEGDGGWVDESSACRPSRAGGEACLAAEQLLLASPWAGRTVILRLAGIYGPSRLPRLRQLQEGCALDANPDGMLNLIHVADATSAVLRAAEARLALPRIFLVSDGHPVARRAFYQELADVFQTPAPRFPAAADELSERSEDRRGHAAAHKRVSNRRMLVELGVVLSYPTYREGVAALAQRDQAAAPTCDAAVDPRCR